MRSAGLGCCGGGLEGRRGGGCQEWQRLKWWRHPPPDDGQVGAGLGPHLCTSAPMRLGGCRVADSGGGQATWLPASPCSRRCSTAPLRALSASRPCRLPSDPLPRCAQRAVSRRGVVSLRVRHWAAARGGAACPLLFPAAGVCMCLLYLFGCPAGGWRMAAGSAALGQKCRARWA